MVAVTADAVDTGPTTCRISSPEVTEIEPQPLPVLPPVAVVVVMQVQVQVQVMISALVGFGVLVIST